MGGEESDGLGEILHKENATSCVGMNAKPNSMQRSSPQNCVLQLAFNVAFCVVRRNFSSGVAAGKCEQSLWDQSNCVLDNKMAGALETAITVVILFVCLECGKFEGQSQEPQSH